MMQNVFFELICFGKWKLIEAYEDQVTIESGDRQLFDFQSEEYVPAPSTKIRLYRDGKYQLLEGTHFSFYEREVLDLCGYKRMQ